MGDIIFFALLAGYIAYKLHNVLGRRDGTIPPQPKANAQNPLEAMFGTAQKEKQSKQPPMVIDAVAIKEETPELDDLELMKQVKLIQERDAHFTVKHFLGGAQAAFELVIESFNKGDKATLQNLLAQDVYTPFEQEIDAREKSDRLEETTLVAINKAEIQDIAISKHIAAITVAFTTEQIHSVKDKKGKKAAQVGDVENVEDKWIFQRDITSPNPNWTIVQT